MTMDLFDLKGKVALVTGAGQGLGRGYALDLSKAGATIICFNRNLELAKETAQMVEKAGGKAKAVAGDVTDLDGIKKTISSIIGEFGHIDILVNNAGTEIPEGIFDVTPEHFDSIVAVNLKGTYFMAQEVARYMVRQGSGKIINIASLGSYIGLAESSVYCCTKGGVQLFTKTLAIELAKNNIQVNAIAPGYFRTSMTEPFFQDPKHNEWINERIPLGRIGTTDDLAGTVIFLASAASNYITGQTIVVDGGWLAS